MPRVKHVKKAQKAQGDCGFCGEPIQVGDAYKWFAFFHGGKYKRHEACPSWKGSELIANDKLSAIAALQESFEEQALETPEDAAQALNDAAESIREVAEMYGENAQNYEDQVNSWADDVETAASELENASAECAADCGETEDEHHEYEAGEEVCKVCEQTKESGPHHEYEESYEDAIEQAVAVIQECPV